MNKFRFPSNDKFVHIVFTAKHVLWADPFAEVAQTELSHLNRVYVAEFVPLRAHRYALMYSFSSVKCKTRKSVSFRNYRLLDSRVWLCLLTRRWHHWTTSTRRLSCIFFSVWVHKRKKKKTLLSFLKVSFLFKKFKLF